MEKIIVTGGSGFIASHLAESLCLENEVVVIDRAAPEKGVLGGGVRFLKEDIRRAQPQAYAGAGAIYHFAADPIVQSSTSNPQQCFSDNVEGTFCVLEAARKSDVKHIIFASTSAVYGNAEMPTPESALPSPISNYAASKLAGEAFLRSYSSCYGIKATVVRYANIFGERSRHGVMHDFFMRLRADPSRLAILGDGKQRKSYLYIRDAVDATLLAAKSGGGQFDIYNIGSEESATVAEIASMIALEMGAHPAYSFAGGEAWKGDVPLMLLDISRIKALGFSQKTSFAQGVKKYVSWLKSL